MGAIDCMLLLIVITLNLVSSQMPQKDIPDFFYNVNFNGPLFDQPVYTVTTSDFSVLSPINTTLFIFHLEPQTALTRPSNVPTARALNNIVDIRVTRTDSTFRIDKLSNFSYKVVNNISPLNYFSPYHRYLFYITATQMFPNRPSTLSTAMAQIDLVNCNVHSPLFVPANQTFLISEKATVGTQFGTVLATDADKDSITFAIMPPSLQFSIDRFTGVLTLAQLVPTVIPAPFILTVIATDDASSCSPSCPNCTFRITSTTITIIVKLANKQPPRFLSGVCGSSFSLLENSTLGTNIVGITAVDDDQGENGQITYSFPSEQSSARENGPRSTASSKFNLRQYNQTNNTRFVELQTNGEFDYDEPGAIRVWYVFVLATDNGIPQLQSLCTIRINLIDVNEYAPVFTTTFWNYTIYPTPNLSLMRVIASDADSGLSGMIDYRMTTVGVLYFIINSTTGAILFGSGVTFSTLDITQFPINFTVYAQDRGSPSRISLVNATVMIYLNTNNTAFPAQWLNPTNGALNLIISEKFFETFPMRPVFDNNQNFNGSIIYQLNTQQSALLIVSSPFPSSTVPFRDDTPVVNNLIHTSGISLTSGLDAEIQNGYLLSLRVSTNPPLIGWATITLSDENDEIPTFGIRSIKLSILGNQVGPRQIAQIPAFDRDLTSPNNLVQYRINSQLTDEMTRNRFFVTTDGTVWTNSTLNQQDQSDYRIILTAFDGSPAWNLVGNTTSNMENFQLDVSVVDDNASPPVFNSTSTNISINETTANGTGILNVTVTDNDLDTILSFGILNGNIKNVFSFAMISNNEDDPFRTQYRATVELSVVAPLDYVEQNIYTLVLFAFDTIHLVSINVTINLLPQITHAPVFDFIQGFNSYQYVVDEKTNISKLNGNDIVANDPNIPATSLDYAIIVPNGQQNLDSLYLNQVDNKSTIGLMLPGLIRDEPFGYSMYNFSIRATNQGGAGVSSYAPVRISVNDINNNGPIPTNSPWIMNEGNQDPNVSIIFKDFDDGRLNNTTPFTVRVVNPSNFTLFPTQSNNDTFTLRYSGVLIRTETKNITVTVTANDAKGFSAITSIPIIVGDVAGNDVISNGTKTINIVYVQGYQNSLQNVNLGSIYVVNSDDWFLAANNYLVINASNGQTFNVNQGFLNTPTPLYPGSYTVDVQVTKNLSSGHSIATSTINMEVTSIDREFVRQAATLRIQGETPETLIDPSLGHRLATLRNALASILLIPVDSIRLLTLRSVSQYRNPIYPPLPFEQAKQEALTDVVFYVPTTAKEVLENTLNTNLAQFALRFGIKANASGPNPCRNYVCPLGTVCRPTRSIQPLPLVIDTNLTSFVGINMIDSPDCVNNAAWSVNPPTTSSDCTVYPFNNATYCPCTNLQSLAPLGPVCEVLGRTFEASDGGSYAVFNGAAFSNLAPARFSFDFALRNPFTVGVILLYGRDTPPIDDYFWIAFDIVDSRQLRFHFRNRQFNTSTPINASAWYHVEYQYVDSAILLVVNDDQYLITVDNNSINSNNQSALRLYLGGLPMRNSLVAGLYPTLFSVNTFHGCIRNVRSNGFYVDMNRPLASSNSTPGQCDCTMTNSCTTTVLPRNTAVIIPWYVWLIIALVLLLAITIVVLIFLACIRRRQQQKPREKSSLDNIENDNDDDTDIFGEQDNLSYNLSVLRKPVYILSEEDITSERSVIGNGGHMGMRERKSLGDLIDGSFREQQGFPLPGDTGLYYA